MNKLYLKSATAIIKINTTESIIKNIIDSEFLYSYIPSVEILEDVEKETVDANIYVEESNENKIEIDYPNIHMTCIKHNVNDIISLSEYVLERARQEKGIICIHGAGAVIDDKLIACWGTATGIGKTTLAIELSKDGNYFYSDEKILIDLKNKKAVGRIKKQYISNDFWKSKFGDSMYHEHDNITKEDKYDIKLFIQPVICNQEEFVLDKWKSEKFMWHLYEESCRKIRGTSRVFFDNTYPVMSLDCDKLAKNRLELLREFTKEITSIYYKGNTQNAKEEIIKFL